MDEEMSDKERRLRDRCNSLLKDAHNKGLMDEQKHLDRGSNEREYWHYGYGMALYDVLKSFKLIEKEGDDENGKTNN